MARVALPESKIKARRRRRRIIAASIAAMCVVIVFTGFAVLANAPFWRINRIDISGLKSVASSTVEQKVRAQLAGQYLFVFPKDNILFYPNTKIADTLLKAMPSIASVSVHAENFQTIAIQIVERQPKALWCGSDPTNPAPCFLLDEGGVAYGAAQNFSAGQDGSAYAKYYGSLENMTTPKQYLTPSDFRSLSALVDTIAASQKSAKIKSVFVDANSDVRLAFDSGFTLMFTLIADGGDVYQRFTLALQSAPFKSHALSDFEYLDLRFGDKLYYKLK